MPLQEYEANLLHMASEARAAGITPLFITAPSNHVAGHEPAYLAKRHVRALSELVPLHAAYVQATKDAAAHRRGARLRRRRRLRRAARAARAYFQNDGIHLTELGNSEMAKVVGGCLLQIK